MICTIETAKALIDFGDMSNEQITVLLSAIEHTIRTYTNNNFQNRNVRFVCSSVENILNGASPFLSVGDTVQISQSAVNDGTYTVVSTTDNFIYVDRHLHSVPKNLVTKVEYPADVVECALNMAKWKMTMADKIGIKSETLSRHSVTYEDSATFVLGYPKAVLSALDKYKKARC